MQGKKYSYLVRSKNKLKIGIAIASIVAKKKKTINSLRVPLNKDKDKEDNSQ